MSFKFIQCLSECPDQYLNQSNICVNCHQNCIECYGLSYNECYSCNSNFFKLNNSCLDNCPLKYYASNHECQKCSQYCLKCLNSSYCLECQELEDVTLFQNQCVDCKLQKYKQYCYNLIGQSYMIDSNFNLQIQLVFNKQFESIDNISSNDIYLVIQNNQIFKQIRIIIINNQIIFEVEILKSFVVQQQIIVKIPSLSKIRFIDDTKINRNGLTLELAILNIQKQLKPVLSDRDKQMADSLNSLQNLLNDENNVVMMIIKYLYFVRLISNNQIIVYSSLMDIRMPINLHFSTQALTSGLKPQLEQYQQQTPQYKDYYKIIQIKEITKEQVFQQQSKIIKFSINGYTNNLLINDPIFTTSFLVQFIIILFLIVIISKDYSKYTQIQFENSMSYQILLFLLTNLLEMIESSFLNILITNYMVQEYFIQSNQYQIYGSIYLFIIDILILSTQIFQYRQLNKQLIDKQQIEYHKLIFEYILYNRDYRQIILLQQNYNLKLFVQINYHLIGFVKKILLFMILIIFYNNIKIQFILIYVVLGFQLILGIVLRPFKTKIQNYMKQFSDLIMIIYFLILQIIDVKMRVLDDKDEEQLMQMNDIQLQQITNSQKNIGYAGTTIQLIYCFTNVFLFVTKIFLQIREKMVESKKVDLKQLRYNLEQKINVEKMKKDQYKQCASMKISSIEKNSFQVQQDLLQLNDNIIGRKQVKKQDPITQDDLIIYLSYQNSQNNLNQIVRLTRLSQQDINIILDQRIENFQLEISPDYLKNPFKFIFKYYSQQKLQMLKNRQNNYKNINDPNVDYSIENHYRQTNNKNYNLKRQYFCRQLTRKRREIQKVQCNMEYCHLFDEQICKIYIDHKQFNILEQQLDVDYLLFEILKQYDVFLTDIISNRLIFRGNESFLPYILQLIFYDKYLDRYSLHQYRLNQICKKQQSQFLYNELTPQSINSKDFIQKEGILKLLEMIKNYSVKNRFNQYLIQMQREIQPLLLIRQQDIYVRQIIEKFKPKMIRSPYLQQQACVIMNIIYFEGNIIRSQIDQQQLMILEDYNLKSLSYLVENI